MRNSPTSVTDSNACGLQACAPQNKVYPKAVIASIRKQLQSLSPLDQSEDERIAVPHSLELEERLRNANLRDAAVSVLLANKRTHTTKNGTNPFTHSVASSYPLFFFSYEWLLAHQMIELSIGGVDDQRVEEIDVLRSREMIQRHTGEHGSICFVVRRPG